MIVVDYSHVQMRMLYMAISQTKPKKKNGKYVTDEFINFYYHLMLNSLRLLQVKFTQKYGQIVLATDSRSNWRKDFYPDYKGNRKKEREESDVDFEEFFTKAEYLLENLGNGFPYKIVGVEKAEADDIIGALAQSYGTSEKVLVVSSDKDFKQLLEYPGVEIYDPIKLSMIRMSPKELVVWKMEHILVGDIADNVPHIKSGTQFSENFIAYLRQNEIFISDVVEFNKLSISGKLYADFDVYKTNKKGEELMIRDIYKTVGFGPVGAKKFAESLEHNLDQNVIYKENYERNKVLVLFEHMPTDIREKIINEYKAQESHFDMGKIMAFINKHSLTTLFASMSDFMLQSSGQKQAEQAAKATSDWF